MKSRRLYLFHMYASVRERFAAIGASLSAESRHHGGRRLHCSSIYSMCLRLSVLYSATAAASRGTVAVDRYRVD